MASKNKPKNYPLLARPGARYTCFGDGLCCTDIHGIGPITKKELKVVRGIDPEGGDWNDDFDDYMLNTAADGGCVFLGPDQRCSIHATVGPDKKPEGCRRFPLGLTATPRGGRITTDHRCPCRTMGKRPLITAEATEPSLRDGDADLESDRDIRKVPISKKKKIDFDAWLEIETPLLEALAKGRSAARLLEVDPFPKLKDRTWSDVAEEFIGARDGTQFGLAMAWFGDTLRVLRERRSARSPARPWSPAFDRAEARSPKARSATSVFNDWVADEIWSLKWADDHHFAKARVDLATRLAVAQDISRRIQEQGARPDRAAAEAVTVIELVGESDFWTEILDVMKA